MASSISETLTFFISGIVFGLLAGYGLPNEGNLLLLMWDVVSKSLSYYFTPEHGLFVFVIGIIILSIATILILRPIIEAILCGVEGLVIFIAGLFCGLLFTSLVRIEIFGLGILILLAIAYFLGR